MSTTTPEFGSESYTTGDGQKFVKKCLPRNWFFRRTVDFKVENLELIEFRSKHFVPIVDIKKQLYKIEVHSLCPGYGTLKDLLGNMKAKGYRFSEEGIMIIFIPILYALNYLHTVNYVHRNITTSSIYITSEGEIQLGDSEYTKEAGSIGTNATIVPGMTPESLVWSPFLNDSLMLGKVLYELIFFTPLNEGIFEDIECGRLELPHYLQKSCLGGILCGMLRTTENEILSVEKLLQSNFILLSMIKFRGSKLFINGDINSTYLSDVKTSTLDPPTNPCTRTLFEKLGQKGMGETLTKDTTFKCTINNYDFALKDIEEGKNGPEEITSVENEDSNSDDDDISMDVVTSYPIIIHDNILITYHPLCTNYYQIDDRSPTNLIMELCQKNMLIICDDLKKKKMMISVPGVYKIICSIANGLYAIHKRNCAHRNLKLENILITYSGEIVLSDIQKHTTTTKKSGPSNKKSTKHSCNELDISNDIITFGRIIRCICSLPDIPSDNFDSNIPNGLNDQNVTILNNFEKGYQAFDELSKKMIGVSGAVPKITEILNKENIIRYNRLSQYEKFSDKSGSINPVMIMPESGEEKVSFSLFKQQIPERILSNEFSIHAFYQGKSKLTLSNLTYKEFITLSAPIERNLLNAIFYDLPLLFRDIDEMKAMVINGRKIYNKYILQIDNVTESIFKLWCIKVKNDKSGRFEATNGFNGFWLSCPEVQYAITNMFALFRESKNENRDFEDIYIMKSVSLFCFLYEMMLRSPYTNIKRGLFQLWMEIISDDDDKMRKKLTNHCIDLEQDIMGIRPSSSASSTYDTIKSYFLTLCLNIFIIIAFQVIYTIYQELIDL